MAAVAELKDFRGQGAPQDVGTYLFPSTIMVFQMDFGGSTFVCAIRCGISGWVPIGYLPLTGANATTVIQAAIDALTAGRTAKEKIVVMGIYIDLAQISLPDYIELEIQGSWTAQANLGASLIVNSGATEIEIHGGHIIADKANQDADMNPIYFTSVTYPWVHHVKVAGGNRVTLARGEGIEFDTCTFGIISNCEAYEADYDNIKLRTSDFCIVISNTCRTSGENHIQTAFGEGNLIADNKCYGGVHGIMAAHGGADNNLIIGNNLYNVSWALRTNAVNGVCENNSFIGNHVFTASRGIYLGGGGAEHTLETFVIANHFHDCGTGIRVGLADRSFISENYITGSTTAVMIEVGSTSNRFGEHYIFNCVTIVTDAGTDTQFPSISVPMAIIGGGATYGVLGAYIATVGEWVVGSVEIKWAAHALVKVCVEGVCNLDEADAMRADLRIWAGNTTLGEDFDTHGEAVILLTENTGVSIDEMIRWSRSSAEITAMKGGDNLSVRIIGLAASAPDCETIVHVRSMTYHYL